MSRDSDAALRPLPLSPQRRRVLAYIASCDAFPSMAEIAAHMGWRNSQSAGDVVSTLRGARYVRRLGPGHYELTEDGRAAVAEMKEAA